MDACLLLHGDMVGRQYEDNSSYMKQLATMSVDYLEYHGHDSGKETLLMSPWVVAGFAQLERGTNILQYLWPLNLLA